MECNPDKNQQNNRIDLAPTDSCGVGMIASIENRATRRVLDLGLTALANVAHRGAIGADGKTGDGAGVSTSIPHRLINRWLNELDVIERPERIGVGVFFVPRDPDASQAALKLIDKKLKSNGLRVLGQRDVPIDENQLGEFALNVRPRVVQIFVCSSKQDDDEFERQLFLTRRSIELTPLEPEYASLYVVSLSCRSIVYKAMVLSGLLPLVYPDLQDVDYECSICIYHQRFSTNTTPQWQLCQPFRMLAHNGEINTIRGNRNWMTAREPSFRHPLWNNRINLTHRLFSFNDSDSASLDNALELLTMSGRSLNHSLSMLIPPSWESDYRLSEEQKAFYQFHSCFCEPWDGPAAIVSFDGKFASACVDRNGLRPMRFEITDDSLLIMGSEAGASRVPLTQITQKGSLGPGQIISVDLEQKKLLFDGEIKTRLAATQPYLEWLNENAIEFQGVESPSASAKPNEQNDDHEASTLVRHQIAAGFVREEVEITLKSMAANGIEPTFSMGVDTPLAVLSRHPRPLSDYFKQRFAQVTNPPIDPIRERSVMSLSTGIGPERNLLDETPFHCRILQLESPILFPGELDQLTSPQAASSVSPDHFFRSKVIDCTWDRNEGAAGMRRALQQVVEQAHLAVDDHASILVLSDRQVSHHRVALPMLMVVGKVHQELYKASQRMMCSLIAETASVRDPHQLALLIGYGCTAVSPIISFRTIAQLHASGDLGSESLDFYLNNYRAALEKGLLKIMSKMGISVLNSYQGAQVFETVGLGEELINECFKYSYTNLGGIGFEEIANDCLKMHDAAFQTSDSAPKLFDLGKSKPKRTGELHVINGKATKNIHRFVRGEAPKGFDEFRELVTHEQPVTVRDLFQFSHQLPPISIDQVESVESIRKRFTTAAMSLGAISPEAHEAIAIAMNEIGGKSNSGEGGEDPGRFFPDPQGRCANSKIKQIASGRFGVKTSYLMRAEEIEIKMAQGAKPGEGGQLPGFKVNDMIARLRNTDPGVTLISPPPHHDIYSIEDLSQLIFDLKALNPTARVSVKLVAKTGVGGIVVGVAKAHADTILISGHEGGTGASPLTSINHAGIPWEIGLAESHQSLVESSLRNQVVLRTDGGLRTGRDIVIAAMLGAEEYNFGTMALIALGCVYVKKCHLNNCPVGIATQDPNYRAKFKGRPENLINYLNAVADDCRQILANIGVPTFDDLIGRTGHLKLADTNCERASMLSLDRILFRGHHFPSDQTPTQQKYSQPPKTVETFDDQVIAELETVDDRQLADEGFTYRSSIHNTDRSIGTRLSGYLDQRLGESKIVDSPVRMLLQGTSGQSLGAFLRDGIQLFVEGDCNDYVGKGMNGGLVVLRPEKLEDFTSDRNIIAGNAVLYGATGGRLFASGRVGERFCVRNSGATAVVEGCGDHGCEYMTRGTAVILGSIGSNFGAGMTGGKVFVYAPSNALVENINSESVGLSSAGEQELPELKSMIHNFFESTKSRIAEHILSEWDNAAKSFLVVRPIEKQ